MKKNNYVVYKHTTPDDKVYIGITRNSPKMRWSNGNGYKNQFFYNAIEEFGWNNIKHEILFKGLSREEAKHIEKELILQYKSNLEEYGYNKYCVKTNPEFINEINGIVPDVIEEVVKEERLKFSDVKRYNKNYIVENFNPEKWINMGYFDKSLKDILVKEVNLIREKGRPFGWTKSKQFIENLGYQVITTRISIQGAYTVLYKVTEC